MSDEVHAKGTESLSQPRTFEAFYRECREDMARALVLALGQRDLGLEATDEAFARALERWDDVGGYDNPEGWVYRVGLNWARTRLRRQTPNGDAVFAPIHLDDLPELELLDAVEQLPIRYRAVVVARFFLDWSIERTASALGIPEGTVKTRQSRALTRLRRRLGEKT